MSRRARILTRPAASGRGWCPIPAKNKSATSGYRPKSTARPGRTTAPGGFRYLINYISTFTTLVPGDVIVTGTPTGAGARFDPPRYLKPGDVIEVEAEGVGLLRNGVVDEVL